MCSPVAIVSTALPSGAVDTISRARVVEVSVFVRGLRQMGVLISTRLILFQVWLLEDLTRCSKEKPQRAAAVHLECLQVTFFISSSQQFGASAPRPTTQHLPDIPSKVIFYGVD